MKNESPKILINLLNKASLFNTIHKPIFFNAIRVKLWKYFRTRIKSEC